MPHCLRCNSTIEASYKACPHCGEPVTDFVRRYTDEPVDGKYKLVGRVGAGGMGELYKVTHVFLGTTRVIKVIRPQISESSDAHERFLREARAATRVQHPNVATLHDFAALPDGSHYMVWEYIDGENVAQRIRARGPLPPSLAVRLTIEALRGLEAIHRAGIVHRDISPENLMLTRDNAGVEHVKIIDLGVAKIEEPDQAATRAGVFVGKLRYASPEHLGFLSEGEKIDGRADLYSVGMVLYEMLTGRPPFEATSPHEYVMLHSRDTQFKPLDLPPDLPGGSELQAALARALERDRNKRFPSAADFAAALESVAKTLVDARSTPTLALVDPHADETLRQTPVPDTLHRSTVRTAVPAEATQQATVVAKPRRNGSRWAVAAVVLVIVAAAAVFLLRNPKAEQPPLASSTATQAAAPPPSPAEGSVEVVSTAPASPTTTAAPSTATLPAAPTPTPVPATRSAAAERAPSMPNEEPAPAAPVRTFTEGGDSDANDQALESLRDELRGTSRVAVHANPEMEKDLLERIRSEAPSVTISDSAEVVVEFQGTLDHLGRGRKRRAAHVTVTKNGHPIFRYEMTPEEYRIGDTPVEAFMRVFGDALH